MAFISVLLQSRERLVSELVETANQVNSNDRFLYSAPVAFGDADLSALPADEKVRRLQLLAEDLDDPSLPSRELLTERADELVKVLVTLITGYPFRSQFREQIELLDRSVIARWCDSVKRVGSPVYWTIEMRTEHVQKLADAADAAFDERWSRPEYRDASPDARERFRAVASPTPHFGEIPEHVARYFEVVAQTELVEGRIKRYDARLPGAQSTAVTFIAVALAFGCGVIAPMMASSTPSWIAGGVPATVYSLALLYTGARILGRSRLIRS